jgi:hypothetical protein
MKTVFRIYKGEIKFLDNKIIITDGIFKWHKVLRIAYAVFFILTGIYLSSRYLVNQQFLMMTLGIVIFAIGLLAVMTGLKISTDTLFEVRQIERAVISKDMNSSLNLTLHLKNSQKRKVTLDYKEEDQFNSLHINELIGTLNYYKIITEVH